MEIIRFEFVGYDHYGDIYPELEKYIFKSMQAENYYFMMAINEAVCNAAKYSVAGIKNVKIKIELKIMQHDVMVSVFANTRPFDAKEYQKNLLELLKNPAISKMDWGDYTADSEMSRGFWYMLTAVDFLSIDKNGANITLCSRIPFKEKAISTKIEYLVTKFRVKNNGVVE